MDHINRQSSTILPDILRTVTLEEILQAVDIVTEEEVEKEQQWNTGVLEGDNGTVFLQSAGNYLDETENNNIS